MTNITLVDLIRILPVHQKISLDMNGTTEMLSPRLLADNVNAVVFEIYSINDTLTVRLLPQQPVTIAPKFGCSI